MSGDERESFRLSLPDDCISFYSEEGKTIFTEALTTGHMNCYFKLAAQFRTQDEPAFCGLSTLVMILNALDVDPGVVWKEPWRWYHENMLNCSSFIPTDKRRRRTISLEHFASVADCNCLDATIVRRTDSNSEENFRQIMKDHSQRDDSFVVASYSRELLKQNGDFDFSPIGGYHPTKELVLLLDTARYKYPPFWIKITSLVRAMNTRDKVTERSRGYIILRKKLTNGCQSLFGPSQHLLSTAAAQLPPDLLYFLQQWTSYLRKESNYAEKEMTVQKTIDIFLSLIAKLNPEHMLLDLHYIDNNCSGKKVDSREYSDELLLQLETNRVFQRILQKMKSINPETPPPPYPWTENGSIERIKQVFQLKRRKAENQRFRLEHLLTVLLLSWPFCCTFQGRNDEVCVGKIWHDYARHEFQSLVEPLATEVVSLSHQLAVRLHLINLGT